MIDRGTSFGQRHTDDPKVDPRLLTGVTSADDLSLHGCRRSGHVHVVAAAHDPAVADHALPGASGPPTFDVCSHRCSMAHLARARILCSTFRSLAPIEG